MFMRDFWKPMPVSGKPIRKLLLLFLLISMKVMQLPFLHIYFLHKKLFSCVYKEDGKSKKIRYETL